jgi:hypothetical protein
MEMLEAPEEGAVEAQQEPAATEEGAVDSDSDDDEPESVSASAEATRNKSISITSTHCEGWLTKAPEEAGLFRHSRKRWFVLKDGVVSYYKDETTSKLPEPNKALIKQFDIKGMNHVAKPGAQLKFDIGNWKTPVTKGKPRVYTLTADTQESFDMWVTALTVSGVGPFSWDDVNERSLTSHLKKLSTASVDRLGIRLTSRPKKGTCTFSFSRTHPRKSCV